MDRTIPFAAFRRILQRYEIQITQGSKTTHYKLSKTVAGERRIYTIAVHRNEVLECYVHKTRRAFGLLPDDGVTDDEFYG